MKENLKLESNNDPIKLDIKRFYSPFNLKYVCEKCGQEVDFLGDNYISYPELNKKIEIIAYCIHCESEYTTEIKLKLCISLDRIVKNVT